MNIPSSPAAVPAVQRSGDVYRGRVRGKCAILAVMAVLTLASVLFDLALGPAGYRLADVVRAVLWPDSASQQLRVVLWDIRMPVALMALVVGAALSAAGAQMQTALNNPLASPFTLGISAAASFGAALGLAFGVRILPFAVDYVVPLNAFVMALLSTLLIYAFGKRRGATAETVVLIGIALVFIFNALVALTQYFASEQAVSAVVFWTMGSLTKATWPKVGIVALVVLVSLPFFAHRAWALTALRLGDDRAASFGIDVRALRFRTLILVSALGAVPVAFVGVIGFVGLVAPHIARMLVGEDQRFFLPASMLIGGLMLSISSVIGKTLIPGAIFPIGVVTSFVGVPFFIYLVLRSKGKAW